MSEIIEIVDAHMHLIDVESNPYPWLKKGAPRPKIFGPNEEKLVHNYLIDDYKKDVIPHHVVKSVHVQANWDHSDPIGETRWLEPISAKHGFPHGVVAFANLAVDNVDSVLDAHLQSPNVRGIRHILNWHPTDPSRSFIDDPDYMYNAKWRRGFALLELRKLSFDLQIYYTQMEDALALANAFPNTAIILNHTGMPIDRTPSELKSWAAAMTKLAKAPNVAVKISGLGLNNPDWTLESIQPIINNTIDIFGIDRCMFASDFPVDKLFSNFATLIDAYKIILSKYTIEEQRKFFKENAERVYRI
jgi:predicted TIM-barrel fold metal-dependent hydrolase